MEKKKIKEHIEFLSVYDFEKSISDLIKMLKTNYKKYNNPQLEVSESYSGLSEGMRVYYLREETDIEFEKRKFKEKIKRKTEKEYREKQDRKTYERLKKKFEGK